MDCTLFLESYLYSVFILADVHVSYLAESTGPDPVHYDLSFRGEENQRLPNKWVNNPRGQKKKKGVAAFKDSEVAGKDGACFDAEVHSKPGEEEKNRRFLKNAPGTTLGMPQKGVQQLWPLHAIKITTRVI